MQAQQSSSKCSQYDKTGSPVINGNTRFSRKAIKSLTVANSKVDVQSILYTTTSWE